MFALHFVFIVPPPLQPIFPLNFQCFTPFTHFTFSFSETPSPGKLEMLVLNLIFRLLFCIGASKFNNFIRLKWILSRLSSRLIGRSRLNNSPRLNWGLSKLLSRLIDRSRLNNSPRPYWCGWSRLNNSSRFSLNDDRSRLNNSPRPYWCGWIKT